MMYSNESSNNKIVANNGLLLLHVAACVLLLLGLVVSNYSLVEMVCFVLIISLYSGVLILRISSYGVLEYSNTSYVLLVIQKFRMINKQYFG